MARVYSKMLARGTITTTGLAVVYTVPADTVTILRCFSFIQASGGLSLYQLVINSSLVVAGVPTTALNEGLPVECRVVLEAGDTIEVGVYAGDWSFYLSGYELSV